MKLPAVCVNISSCREKNWSRFPSSKGQIKQGSLDEDRAACKEILINVTYNPVVHYSPQIQLEKNTLDQFCLKAIPSVYIWIQ